MRLSINSLWTLAGLSTLVGETKPLDTALTYHTVLKTAAVPALGLHTITALTNTILVVDRGIEADIKRFEAAKGKRTAFEQAREDIESSQISGRVMLFGGAALVAAGAALLLDDHSPEAGAGADISVIPSWRDVRVIVLW